MLAEVMQPNYSSIAGILRDLFADSCFPDSDPVFHEQIKTKAILSVSSVGTELKKKIHNKADPPPENKKNIRCGLRVCTFCTCMLFFFCMHARRTLASI